MSNKFFQELLNEMSAAGEPVVYPKGGFTSFYPVLVDGSTFIERGKSYFDGTPTRKMLIFVVCTGAADTERMPDNYTARVLPLVLPFSVAKNLINLLADDQTGNEATAVSADGKVTHQGTHFKLDRKGTGIGTEYQLMPIKANNLPAELELPEGTLAEVVVRWQAGQDARNAQFAQPAQPADDPNNIPF